jgi:hypothetical protein
VTAPDADETTLVRHEIWSAMSLQLQYAEFGVLQQGRETYEWGCWGLSVSVKSECGIALDAPQGQSDVSNVGLSFNTRWVTQGLRKAIAERVQPRVKDLTVNLVRSSS